MQGTEAGAAIQLTFEEEAESSLGPFSSTAKLMSVGGTVFYASGKGRVSTRLSHLYSSLKHALGLGNAKHAMALLPQDSVYLGLSSVHE